MIACASFYPQNERAWANVMTRPGAVGVDAVQARLYQWLVEMALRSGIVRLDFQFFPGEDEAVNFVQLQGGDYSFRIYALHRPLAMPIPDSLQQPHFSIRLLRLQTEAEQSAYLTARRECFPEENYTVEELRFLLASPLWEKGVCVAGYAGDSLVGSVLVYWEPGSPLGFTENVFTLPSFRGRGLARALLTRSLGYLIDHGLENAHLEVKAENEAALSLYQELGYVLVTESKVFEINVRAN